MVVDSDRRWRRGRWRHLSGPADGAGEANGSGVEEVLLQGYLFLGYPTALNAIALWRQLSGRLPSPPEEDDWET